MEKRAVEVVRHSAQGSQQVQAHESALALSRYTRYMMFSMPQLMIASTAHITSAMSMEATMTMTVLLAKSVFEGQETLWTSSL